MTEERIPVKAKKILSIFNQTGEFGYIKSDGSLDDGWSLSPIPVRWRPTCVKVVPWREALEKIQSTRLLFPPELDLRAARACEPVHFFRTAQAEQDEKDRPRPVSVRAVLAGAAARFSRRTQRAGGLKGRKIRIWGIPGARSWSMPRKHTRGPVYLRESHEHRYHRIPDLPGVR